MSRYRTGVRMFAAAGLMAVAMGGVALPAHAGPPPVSMSGAEEVPSNASTATGTFSYKIKGDRLCYTLSVSDLQAAPTGAHIHEAQARVVGPVVIPLEVEASTSFTTEDCVEADKSLLKDIRHNPSEYYVNVHSQLIPSGEIRGQLG